MPVTEKQRLEGFQQISTYEAYFLDEGKSLPLIGNTDEGIVRLGAACKRAVMQNKPLTDAEIDKLAPKAPEGADI